MGMLFNSQAVVYLGGRLTAEFAEIATAPAKGLTYWKGTSAEAKEFRDALDGSWQNTVPALGSITLEYFDVLIPDSLDGEGPPPTSDPSAGKGYKRWIIFWKDLRKKDKASYKKLVKGVLNVLDGTTTGINSITFAAKENNTIKVDIVDTGTKRAITLFTPKWHKVKNLAAVKKAAKKKKR
jgi:hypothetical protein